MKSKTEINRARGIVADTLQLRQLTAEQRCLFCGMLNALVWAADGPASSSVDRLLAGEPVAAGKDSSAALERLQQLARVVNVQAVRLVTEGDDVVVYVQMVGHWVEIIRAPRSGDVEHVIEDAGIRRLADEHRHFWTRVDPSLQ